MGKTIKIEELQKTDEKFREYISKIENELREEMKVKVEEQDTAIKKFCSENKFECKTILAGKNSDFMQRKEWSFKNVAQIVNDIADFIFGDASSKPPAGVEENSIKENGEAIKKLEHTKNHVKSCCLALISGAIKSLSATTTTNAQSQELSEPIGNGMHVFVSVSSKSYQSKGFFENSEIVQFQFVYKVLLSSEEAKAFDNQMLLKMYSDQLAQYIDKLEKLNADFSDITLDINNPKQSEPQMSAYNTFKDILEKSISETQDKIDALEDKKDEKALPEEQTEKEPTE
ncbi:hypothetical protein [Vibrio coralliilyticus]|uniref:hypothetical protein n=1 Tax=Vibrio coralliilyticus TaxID=190893 RepID=UPI00155FB162|nr:hypothetical protein [Vibrio coralliilyticus]NRF28246.1 hypothetical protein [Vibrio coralliilyticus]NRF51943.1 hypothetical protein [Vibrio coralliilyticus]